MVNYVGPHTAPMFFWHNRFDKYVPVINPILMAEAMIKYKLPFEMHIFQSGEHGMSVCNELFNPTGEKMDRGVACGYHVHHVAKKSICKVNYITQIHTLARNR